MAKKIRGIGLAILLLAFFAVLMTTHLAHMGEYHYYRNMTLDHAEFRRTFFCSEMLEAETYLSEECESFLRNVRMEIKYFPVPESTLEPALTTSFVNSWQAERNYQGQHAHEGTDIMASCNVRGIYPIVSMTDGVVVNLGWLEKGGYRIGIAADSGTYYYYAHLASYANVKVGDPVKAGDLLGYMGDSGYGSEGTTGMFPVHLHLGIYVYQNGAEISVNPYYVLQELQDDKLAYAYTGA